MPDHNMVGHEQIVVAPAATHEYSLGVRATQLGETKVVTIKAGTGVHVDLDFTRLMVDTPLEVDQAAMKHARPFEVWGWIAGDATSRLGFMRRVKVRVCTERKYVVGL